MFVALNLIPLLLLFIIIHLPLFQYIAVILENTHVIILHGLLKDCLTHINIEEIVAFTTITSARYVNNTIQVQVPDITCCYKGIISVSDTVLKLRKIFDKTSFSIDRFSDIFIPLTRKS